MLLVLGTAVPVISEPLENFKSRILSNKSDSSSSLEGFKDKILSSMNNSSVAAKTICSNPVMELTKQEACVKFQSLHPLVIDGLARAKNLEEAYFFFDVHNRLTAEFSDSL